MEEGRFSFLQGRAAPLGRDGMSTLSRKGMGELARAIIVGHAPARKGGGAQPSPRACQTICYFLHRWAHRSISSEEKKKLRFSGERRFRMGWESIPAIVQN